MNRIMEVTTFINNYREAFGEKPALPLAFWYSDEPIAQTERINGCFFKTIPEVLAGTPVSLSVATLTCGGGKFYSGFAAMPERVPGFVSLTEKYKRTPEMVIDFLEKYGVPRTDRKYLNFARIDQIEVFDGIEGIVFFATPDMLSGLVTWALFDNNGDDGVSTLFGSGCSSIVTNAVIENSRGGRRTFLGMFDPSVRKCIDQNVLSFTIPITRFREMYGTMRETCLFDTHDWEKIRERINS